MLSIKTEYNSPRDCFNDFISLMKETNLVDNLIHLDLYKMKKLASKLGLTTTKIDYYINGCMLYYKDDVAEVFCRTCNAPRFKPNSGLQALAWGPMQKVKTWSIYIVNGFRFHTKSWSEGRKTENCGVCVRGNTHEEDECDYYGILNEVFDLEYPGEDENFNYLFNCQWYDPVHNRGTRVHPAYGLVDVKHSKRYGKFDPFVLESQPIQDYFSKYPSGHRDKQDWIAIIKIKAREIIDQQYILVTAHQEDEMLSCRPVEIEEMQTTTSSIKMELEDVNNSTSSGEDENEDESEDTLESSENSFDDSE
ncbi:hypothetical protein MA16_Dca024891 [Dendrobium catenatum]|uniref:DUF4216 domain-containing protein n=1 Tax=Dendrobium catenatum TaxID=906689 RepID=A0A2I0VAM4_9ASPA|nr:hypothetical protein MA16_Dca024891 [Dendrobium catenatum]